MIRISLLAATALVVAAPLAAAPTTMAPEFVKTAGASDLFERTSSKLVLDGAKTPDVRAFATMMIKDHTKSTADVVAAAKADGLNPGKPMLNAAQSKMVAQLKAAKPADREKLYLSQQVGAHQQALDLMHTYSQGGDKPHLKMVAGKITPTVEMHLAKVKQLAAM